jgi:hypothetical protein
VKEEEEEEAEEEDERWKGGDSEEVKSYWCWKSLEVRRGVRQRLEKMKK